MEVRLRHRRRPPLGVKERPRRRLRDQAPGRHRRGRTPVAATTVGPRSPRAGLPRTQDLVRLCNPLPRLMLSLRKEPWSVLYVSCPRPVIRRWVDGVESWVEFGLGSALV